CPDTEVFISNKGCVDRKAYLDRLLITTWDDASMKVDKNKAGRKQTVDCKKGEVLKAFACAPEKKQRHTGEWERPTILQSQLYDNKVFKGSDGIPRLKDSSMQMVSSTNFARKRSHGSFSNQGHKRNLDNDEDLTSGHVVGHNRARSYVYMPGRRLISQRQCRPYELPARNGRCIRKRGKTGLYKHTDHQYGIKQRHRQEVFK
ncbi:hypothetical protein KR044_003383, partial [Drosophila immigrans]